MPSASPGERVMTVGDGRNDIEMLAWATRLGGRGVAMGQAPPEVVEAAAEVTERDTADGLALALAGLRAAGAPRSGAGRTSLFLALLGLESGLVSKEGCPSGRWSWS